VIKCAQFFNIRVQPGVKNLRGHHQVKQWEIYAENPIKNDGLTPYDNSYTMLVLQVKFLSSKGLMFLVFYCGRDL